MTDTAFDVRERLISFFRRDLVGPAHGEEEILDERPSLRYSAGVLFPRSCRSDESSEVAGVGCDPAERDADPTSDALGLDVPPGADSDQAESAPGYLGGEDNGEDTVTLANTFKPSALGLSFAVQMCDAVVVAVSAAVYAPLPGEERRRWRRQALSLAPVRIPLGDGAATVSRNVEVAQGLRLRVVARRRRTDGTQLCTVSLVNDTLEGRTDAREFLQVGLAVRATDGSPCFRDYGRLTDDSSDAEDRTLAMLYRERGRYAIGHGCAAEWSGVADGRTAGVRTEVVPAVRVPPVVPTTTTARWADMAFLSAAETTEEDLFLALGELPADYETWIDRCEGDIGTRAAEFADRAIEHVRLCRVALGRIRAGIQLLRDDDYSLRAFKMMNEAMLRQQHHARLRRRLDDEWPGLPNKYSSTPGGAGYWRTFQIAFILMTIAGLVPEAPAPERSLLDLIWFPTGGGKTEAYLGAAAFALFRRRLADPANGGCTVLMRYTLRLLTSQQFQRAASLVCACELTRRARPSELGTEPLSIGLWVGSSLTPNTEADAKAKLNSMAKDADASNPFQLLACPWCGTTLNDRNCLGYVSERQRVVFRCPAGKRKHGAGACPFSEPDRPLPVCVVDESIYATPPSLLIGTVDKFAMLAWRPQARSIFGVGRVSPPTLIIQDELHLISGPLGSMVGLYEGAIDLLCRQASGRGPKIIASTATIRRAAEQCRALYDRGMAQFPPQGLDAADSYFAHESKEDDGRVYVGFLPTAASSPLTAQIRAMAALAQGILIVAGDAAPREIDPYWTLVQYFSSLKELGRAATLVAADVPEYLPSMQRRYGIEKDARRRIVWSEEMTARKRDAEIPKILRELEQRYTGIRGDPADHPLDTLLATNMISVGVDVDRLGLMMIVTQPKGTSEYIQASSRVGRSRGAPGLVVTLYNAARPRDRSHYEQFRSYHEAFYRFVEPTSVTPFAVPALERALHAVMVVIARQIAGVREPPMFDPNEATYREALAFIRKRVQNVDPDQVSAFDAWVGRREREWTSWRPDDWGGWTSPDRNFLMHPAGLPAPGGDFEHYRSYWWTPQSMRDVDAQCDGTVVSYPQAEG